jgi:membrane protease YdiL (CAAX protease family)
VTPTLVAVLGLLVVHNLVTNLWLRGRGYVPVNLATAGVVLAVSGVGVSAGGVAAGVAAALVVLVALGLLATHPGGRRLLADRRMAGVDTRGTAWRALVRIPLGTVVLEEVAFRAVLPALLSPVAAAGLFGLWHVVPTATALDINGITSRRRPIVAGAVVVTTLVGLGLSWLAAKTGGLLAPALVHAAANSGATVATFVVLRKA